MVSQNPRAQLNLVDEFVKELGSTERKSVREWVYLPNTPHCRDAVMQFLNKYGPEAYDVSDKVESLRRQTGWDYRVLQPILQKKLAE